MYLNRVAARFYAKIVRPRFISERYLLPTIRRIVSLESKNVLDFGCGPASNTFMFEATRYLGIDINPGRVAYARKLYPRYQFVLGDGKSLPVRKATVDLIFICGVLHHISDTDCEQVCGEFDRVLSADGELVVLEPVLSKRSPLRTAFMRMIDAGSFLRDQEGYMRLLTNRFDVTFHGMVRTPNFYNAVVLTAVVRRQERRTRAEIKEHLYVKP